MARRFSPEEIILLSYARTDVPPRLQRSVKHLLTSPLDWDRLFSLAVDHRLAGLLYWNLKQADRMPFVPHLVCNKLAALYREQLARYLLFAQELEHLIERFNRVGVQVTVLKGMALTEQLYGNPGLRPVNDIDLLIREHDRFKSDSVLCDEGYLIDHSHDEKVVWQHSYVNWQKCILVDLHWHLTTVYNFNRATGVNLAEMWAGAEMLPLGRTQARAFNPVDQIIYLAIHLAVHHNFDTLIQLCDVNQAIRRYTRTLSRPELVRKARAYRVKNIVYFALYFAKTLLDSPVPRWVLIGLRPSPRRRREFLHHIVSPDTYFHPDTRHRLARTLWYESLLALADNEQQAYAIQESAGEFQRLYGESAQVERAKERAARIA